MIKKKSELQIAQEETEKIAKKINKKIEALGEKTSDLFERLNSLQGVFDAIRGVPNEEKLKLDKLKKVRLNWIQQVEKISAEYKTAQVKAIGGGAVGTSAGIAIVALGPTAAMGVATTFGVASTGTAISALSGAAATNAALAWIGGGALAVGGGGIAAGNIFLALTGPVGWAIASAALLSSGLLFWKNNGDKKRLEKIFISISHRDTKSYQLAIVELNERSDRIMSETELLSKMISVSKSYGTDYDKMTEQQQLQLITFVNFMYASTQLLVNPILGLQPKYTEKDYSEFLNSIDYSIDSFEYRSHQIAIVSLANLLYKIDLDMKDKRLLWSSLNKNKEFLEAMHIDKKTFDLTIIDKVESALNAKYN